MSITRRSFLALSTAFAWSLKTRAASASIPVGLELYSVRNALKQDAEGTVRAVAKMGYQCVEFFAPYFDWSEARAKQMRKLLDDLGIRCYSTHNDASYFHPDKLQHACDLNLILGTKYMVWAYSEPKSSADGWKAVADELNAVADRLAHSGLRPGYHNHDAEWKPVGGVRPMEILARNTKPEVMLQLDVGTCLAAGADPVAWIRANPGRIHSLHAKDWSSDPSRGYQVLLGEGEAKWKDIFAAAQSVGGAEYYLIEQEGSRYGELETARRSLESYRAL